MPIALTAHTEAGARLVAGADDGLVFAAAISEPDQDLTRPTTAATRTESGWRIDGCKLFCTMSPAATDLYVAVTYSDRQGVERYAYAIVPTDAPGVVVHDDWDALGMRASASNSISLEGVELPESGVRGGFRAGNRDVGTLNPDYYRAAREPKQIWRVPAGGHTDGIEVRPDEYERRVVAFLDDALLGD